MEKPNIFSYAKKELTQDAFIAWLFECLKCDNEYNKIGKSFIKFIFDNNLNDCDIELDPLGVNVQHYRMDLYVVLRINNVIYPIIVEDKANTFLHGDQFKSYCEKVASWMKKKSYLEKLKKRFNNDNLKLGNLVYLYYKSGFVANYEMEEFKKMKVNVVNQIKSLGVKLKVKEIYLDDMISFLNKLQVNDELLENYLDFLKTYSHLYNESYTKSLQIADIKTYCKRYSNSAGCYGLFENCFGTGTVFDDHLYQNWASKSIFKTGNENEDIINDIFYDYRFETYSEGDKPPYFLLEQYRNERYVKGDKEKLSQLKIEQAKEIQKQCQHIISEMNTTIRYDLLNINEKRVQNSNKLLKVYINEDNTPEKVCEFIKLLTIELIKRVNTKWCIEI